MTVARERQQAAPAALAGQNPAEKIGVLVPTIYHWECPTVRSRLLPLCSRLVSQGFTFTFLVRHGGAPPPAVPGVAFARYASFAGLIRLLLSACRQQYRIVLACKPYSLTAVLPWLLARFFGIGFVLDADDRIFPSEINKWWRLPLYVQEWGAERLLRSLRPLTVVASAALQQHYGSHAVYIPNTVDLEVFRRDPTAVNVLVRRFQVCPPVVVWPAVFFQEIDRVYPLEIFRELQARRSRVSLLILGEGEYYPRIRERAAAMRLQNVHFGGAVAHHEMPAIYAGAAAGLLPLRNNHYDACKGPIKLYEYMAMELPVISTPIGEPLEAVRQADCGIFIPFAAPQKAAEAIDRLLADPAAMRVMGRNGRKYLEQRHTLDHHALRLGEVLHRALGAPRQQLSTT